MINTIDLYHIVDEIGYKSDYNEGVLTLNKKLSIKDQSNLVKEIYECYGSLKNVRCEVHDGVMSFHNAT
jgi:hypothetical protein